MARGEVTGRTSNNGNAADPADAYSVDEFCARHRISPQLFYKLRPLMPVTFNVGTRVLISREAAAAWRREREDATQKSSLDRIARYSPRLPASGDAGKAPIEPQKLMLGPCRSGARKTKDDTGG